MKKYLFSILCVFAIMSLAHTPINVVAFKKDKVSITTGDSVMRINPSEINYVEPYGTGARVYITGLQSPNYLTMFDTRENIDSIYRRANATHAILVKLRKSYINSAGRDSSSFVLVRIASFKTGVAKTITGNPSTRSMWYLNISNGIAKWNFQESRDSVQARIDSLVQIKK